MPQEIYSVRGKTFRIDASAVSLRNKAKKAIEVELQKSSKAKKEELANSVNEALEEVDWELLSRKLLASLEQPDNEKIGAPTGFNPYNFFQNFKGMSKLFAKHLLKVGNKAAIDEFLEQLEERIRKLSKELNKQAEECINKWKR